MKNTWHQFYKSRVNNELYLDKFIGTYKPYLDQIRLRGIKKPLNIVEEGVGIGNVPKALHRLGMKPIVYIGTDIDTSMLSLARRNKLPDWVGLKTNDINNLDFNYSNIDLVTTHGVLEHFDDDNIIEILRKYASNFVSNIHYVPLIGHGEPFFGDERLLSHFHWLGLINEAINHSRSVFRISYILFNDKKDMAFSLELLPYYQNRLINGSSYTKPGTQKPLLKQKPHERRNKRN